MTLVAARRVGSAIAVTADWRLTLHHRRPSFQTGALKVIVLHPKVLCAYAGDVDTALSAIRALGVVDSSISAEDFVPDMIAGLLSASTTGECDFLVAYSDPEPAIVRIKNGETLASNRASQIGDSAAIEALLDVEESRRLMTAGFPALDDAAVQERVEAGQVSSALDDLIRTAGDSLPTIGELAVMASTWPDGFRYSQTQSVVLTQDVNLGHGDEVLQQNASARRIDGGSMRLNVCPPMNPGVGALAMHFPQHRIGLFTHPMLIGAEVVTYKDTDSRELAERVLGDYGVLLDVVPDV